MVAIRFGGLGTNMSAHSYWISYSNEGILISRDQPDVPEPFRACHSSPEIAGFVGQLQDEAYAVDTLAGAPSSGRRSMRSSTTEITPQACICCACPPSAT